MVKVELFKSKTFGYLGIRAIDHAEDSLVCSAVSNLLQGFYSTLINIEEKPHLEKVIMQSGYFELEIRPMETDEERKVIDALFFFVQVTLAQLNKKYPQYVDIIVNKS